MDNIEGQFCQAVDIIVQKAISSADYDRTIQASIVSCIDETIGKYECSYQDSKFYAYSNNSEVTYSAGAAVYVLVPGNDMSKEKTILGTTKKLGINYVVTTEGDENYEVNGENCIKNSDTFSFSSYNGAQEKVLYSKLDSINDDIINETDVNQYIKNSGNIIYGAHFRTALDAKQQSSGNFGIIFDLDFLIGYDDNNNEKIETRRYIVDVNQMVGTPYRQTKSTRQYGISEIDNTTFKEINSIRIFCKDFPYTKSAEECKKDIFISDIELCGATRLSSDDLSNYSLTLLTPQGNYFANNLSNDEEIKTIQAQVRVKGKVIDNDSQDLKYYWFVQDLGINNQSLLYNKYGGAGWKCLNSYNITQSDEEGIPTTIEWVPASYLWTVSKSEVIAKENQYKCVVIYDETVITKTMTIKNLASNWNISIESDSGTQFYFDNGYPTLKCYINGEEKFINDSGEKITYSWAVTNNVGNFENIAVTEEENTKYNNCVAKYKELKEAIDKGEKSKVLNEEELQNDFEQIAEYDTIQRVEENTIYHLNVSSITSFSTYQCAVYSGNIYLGAASITIINSWEREGEYSLVINNGSASYKYNENSVSPASSSLDSPISIKALTFTVYNNLGQKIDDNDIKYSDIQWIVPTNNGIEEKTLSNTLITIPDNYEPTAIDLLNHTATYSNLMSFSYGIKDRYNIDANNNDIYLQVTYDKVTLSAKTSLTFVKEGENGTNGTEYFCKIVPNVADGEIAPTYPTITQIGEGTPAMNYTPKKSGCYFKVQLWRNEEQILDTITNAESTEGVSAGITWSILQNQYEINCKDPSILSVDASTGVFSFSSYQGYRDYKDKEGNIKYSAPANIVKVTVEYNGMTYYATLPVLSIHLEKSSSGRYALALKENTGFQYVTYNASGKRPQYNSSNPFEIQLFDSENGGKDIAPDNSPTDFTKETNQNIIYKWNYLGRIRENKAWEESPCLKNKDTKNEPTTYINEIKVIDEYDGQCVTNAVEVVVLKKNDEIGRIHIPVHFTFNRYSLTAINAWDGNSVQVNSDGGYIYSPQVGAGEKNDNNQFTGLLMGKVKEVNSSEEIGLLGYHEGIRTIFLDSKTGKAEFGKNDAGQIILDPSSKKAIIKSGNYSTSDKTGMQIDLTTPEIKFGSGNFVVDKNGFLTAKRGTIAGWTILEDDGHSELYKDKVGMNSYISEDKGNDSIAFWAGSTDREKGRFRVSFGGHLWASEGTIGSGLNKITIGKSDDNNSALYSGEKSSFSADKSGFYIGTDGIALGRVNAEGISNFQVTSQGKLTARSGYIGNGENGWTIGNKSLYNGKTTYNGDKNEGVYIGTDGIGLGTGSFYVTKFGSLHAVKGDIGGWTIATNKLSNESESIFISKGGIKYKDSFSVSSEGKLTASGGDFNGKITSTSGKIGGWTIVENGLKSGNINISSNGSISCDNWSINGTGSAKFNNITCTGTINAKGGYLGSSKNTVSSSGLDYNNGTVNLQNSTTNQGIVWDTKNLTVKGSITAKALTIEGDTNVSGIKLYTDNSHYLYFSKSGNKHPTVSGLNVESGGIAMGGNGISKCKGISNTDGDMNVTCKDAMTIQGESLLYLKGGDGSNTSAKKIMICTSKEDVDLVTFIQGVIDGTYT